MVGILLHRDAGAVSLDDLNDDNDISSIDSHHCRHHSRHCDHHRARAQYQQVLRRWLRRRLYTLSGLLSCNQMRSALPCHHNRHRHHQHCHHNCHHYRHRHPHAIVIITKKAFVIYASSSNLLSLSRPQVKWRLMIASCYRRAGNYHKVSKKMST